MSDKKPLRVADRLSERGITLSVIVQSVMLAVIIGGGKLFFDTGVFWSQKMIDRIETLSSTVTNIARNDAVMQTKFIILEGKVETNHQDSQRALEELATRTNKRFNLDDMQHWCRATVKTNNGTWKCGEIIHKREW